ncbi:MAG TPA: hypothetical protein VE820_12470 [Sphingomicrobium sp.]|jgi:hypothetical protein|nr:hypothetical protein [Sphingomicrobium sp.]
MGRLLQHWIEQAPSRAPFNSNRDRHLRTVAREEGGGPDGAAIDLRWPTKGRQAEKSIDKLATWDDACVVTPEPASTSD